MTCSTNDILAGAPLHNEHAAGRRALLKRVRVASEIVERSLKRGPRVQSRMTAVNSERTRRSPGWLMLAVVRTVLAD